MAFLSQLFSKKSDNSSVNDEVIELPVLKVGNVPNNLQLEKRKMEELLCKHYNIQLPKHGEMI